jgi:hypothetical protein
MSLIQCLGFKAETYSTMAQGLASQTVRQLQIVILESLEMPAKCGLS